MATLHIASDLIVSDPEVMSGAPCFAGTRVPVAALFGSLAEGMTLDSILQEHPALTRDTALKALDAATHCLQFHASRIRESADFLTDEAICMTCEGRRHLLSGPDMLNAEEIAKLLGIDEAEVIQRTREHRLLALPHPDARHRLFYPEWQFNKEVLPHLPDILLLLAERDPWMKYRFFHDSNPLLHDETPIEALLTGDVKAVMTVARIVSENEQ